MAAVRDIRISGDAKGFHHLVEVHTTRNNMPKVIKGLRKAEGIQEVDMAYVERGRAVALIVNDGCPMCKTAYGSGCFIRSASSRPSGEVEWRVLLRRGQSVKPLLDGFASVGLEAWVAEVRKVGSFNRTTSRQEDILLASMGAGYFDYPRRVGVKKLAKTFGIAPSTLSETIRRGEKNVLNEYLTSLRQA